MVREILFKAKRSDGKGWVQGDFFRHTSTLTNFIRIYDVDYDQNIDIKVIPETVCQFTGLKDKNGEKIFEGDILTGNNYPYKDEGVDNYQLIVEFIHGCWQGVLQCVNPEKLGISNGVNGILCGDGQEIISDIQITGKNIHDEK